MAEIEMEQLLARRELIADEMVAAIGRLGALLREETELQDRLRRIAEADGSRTNAFATSSSVMDGINSELVREGVSPRRSDPRFRLTQLISGQHGRYRAQFAVRKQVAGRSVA